MAKPILRCTRLAIATGPPPTIVVEYDCGAHSPISRTVNESTAAGEPIRIDHRRHIIDHRRRKTIRLHNLATSSDSAEVVAHRLGRKFPGHLGPKVVKHAQLQGLIFKLQRLVRAGSTTDGVPEEVAVKDQHQGQHQGQQELDAGDLNLASENELVAAKMRMSVVFEQNLLQPGSPGYVHDVRKDFDQPQEECDWDDDDSS